MSHLNQYKDIINYRKDNPLPENAYGENHHIVPKSICPILAKAKDNVVRLSAQEHFMAHYHLWKAYRDELKEKTWARKMCLAFHRMKQQLLKCDDMQEMAKLYKEVRIQFALNQTGNKNHRYGKHYTMSDETKRKISETKRGSRNPMYGNHKSKETRIKLSKALMGHDGYWTGKHQTKDVIEKRAAKMRGRHWYTDGIKNVVDFSCPIGFHKGKTFHG